MAWTAPRTWVTGETVTAALLNTHLRDNLNQFDAKTAGSFFLSDGSGPVARMWGSAVGDASYTGVGANDNTDFLYSQTPWSSGTSVATTVTTNTEVLVIHGFAGQVSTGGGLGLTQSYQISGATTVAASDTWRAYLYGLGVFQTACRVFRHTGLNAGSNTFTLVAESDDISVSSVRRPYIFVLPL